MQKIQKNSRGFSLPELIVSMFIFVLIMLVVTSVFVVLVKTRKEAQEMQRDMENIRYALEFMAKNIRMSEIDGWNNSRIYIYNYSQEKCMHFNFSDEKILFGEVSGDRKDLPDCQNPNPDYEDKDLVAAKIDNVMFDYQSPAASTLGRVTISVTMAGTKESAQTTVSLRNYNIIQ